MSTERLSKDNKHKRSIDYGATRMKTDMDEVKPRSDPNSAELSLDQLREIALKLRNLRSEKEKIKK